MVAVSLAAAAKLAEQGCRAEVIDLRTLWPWDRAAVFKSVSKTGRLLVVHEAVRIGGFGGKIVAEIAERMFGSLKTAPRTPIPFSEPLENQCRVTDDRIIATALEMIGCFSGAPVMS